MRFKEPVSKKSKPELLSWLKTRKKILRQIKKRVDALLVKEPRELVNYRKVYERGFQKKFQLSDIVELVTEMQQAQVVFGGDFHAFSQAQRMHLKILRRYAPQENITIALEATTQKQNKVIESFLNAKISEKTFLKMS